MGKSYLLIDATYFAYRAFYSTRSYTANKTAALFGFLRDVEVVKERFCTDNLIFCFDYGINIREQMYKPYKAKRRIINTDTAAALKTLHRQVKQLREEILLDLGFVNIFYEDGYEADDVIASVVTHYPENIYTIVSADHDMYQLLKSKSVVMYDPRLKVITTEKSVIDKYGISPDQWAMMKAIGGCVSDNIKGVNKVREKTALKFLRGELVGKPMHKYITANLDTLVSSNLLLTKLPLKDCPKFVPYPQEQISQKLLREAMERYGFAGSRK